MLPQGTGISIKNEGNKVISDLKAGSGIFKTTSL